MPYLRCMVALRGHFYDQEKESLYLEITTFPYDMSKSMCGYII